MSWFLVLVISVIAALHFQSDVDLMLRFLPFTQENSVLAFKGKVVWITGASSGIGAQLAKDYTASGAQVIISARRAANLEAVARDCALLGHAPLIVPLDVTDYSAETGTVYALNHILETYGHIDTLVLNAGRSQRSLALETDIDDTRNLMELNVMSYINLSKQVVPHMVKRGSGDVVVVGSIAGKIATPISSSYSATKFALQGYYDAFRAEVSHLGINVLLVCPGPVKSEIVENAVRPEGEGGSGKEVFKQDIKVMPTGRCTHLILKALYWGYDEVWISDQPFLATTYVAEYVPDLTRYLFKTFIGPSRAKAFKDGASVFDVKEMLKNIFMGSK